MYGVGVGVEVVGDDMSARLQHQARVVRPTGGQVRGCPRHTDGKANRLAETREPVVQVEGTEVEGQLGPQGTRVAVGSAYEAPMPAPALTKTGGGRPRAKRVALLSGTSADPKHSGDGLEHVGQDDLGRSAARLLPRQLGVRQCP